MENFKHIQVVTTDDNGVAIVQLNRPEKRNAFTQAMISEIVDALALLDLNGAVRVVVFTGQPEGPFCAGMDLNELVKISTTEAEERNFLKDLTDAFAQFSKPLIAAVIGFALGGGFELVLACDIIYAAEDAKFGLPEIKIGTIPGAGGTQYLTRALGKYKAMEFILTGDTATGIELERWGLVSKVFRKEDVLAAALKLAARIAGASRPVVAAAKKAVLTAENSLLDKGIAVEKSLYYSTFSTADCKEGLTAFLEKRPPVFTHQ